MWGTAWPSAVVHLSAAAEDPLAEVAVDGGGGEHRRAVLAARGEEVPVGVGQATAAEHDVGGGAGPPLPWAGGGLHGISFGVLLM